MQQKDALRILISGANVFLTGAAGSGKTHLLRAFLRWADNEGKTVAVTASTGIAATHMGGMTIHSWSGMGIEDSLTDTDIAKIAFDKKLNKRFNSTSILIIDEISMLHAARLDMVDAILKKARNCMKPFGGIQVICSGDFFQLPPITRDNSDFKIPFAFYATSWMNANFAVCYLCEQFRQTEESMTHILNEIRSGHVSTKTKELLQSRIGVAPRKEGATRLYAQNIDVDRINAHHLSELYGDLFSFKMTYEGPLHLVNALKKNCLAPEILNLKENARVMFVRNDPQGKWVNGTIGTVEYFDEMGEPVIKKNDGKSVTPSKETWIIADGDRTLAKINQYPLRLAWAITIHKSQGMSLDSAEIDLRNAFVRGMGYVALSRVRTISGLSLIGINNTALLVDETVRNIDLEFKELSEQSEIAGRELKSPSDEELSGYLHGATRKAAQLRTLKKFDKTNNQTKEKKIKKEYTQKETISTETKRKSYLITNDLLQKEKTPKEIAKERGLTTSTILEHIEQCVDMGVSMNYKFLESLISPARLLAIAYAIETEGDEKISKLKEALPPEYTWDEIKLARATLRLRNKK